MRIPSWSSLRTLGDSKVLRSSYVWIVIVPIAAKALSRIEPLLDVRIGNQVFKLDLSLPFSWQLFFYGALLTSIANTLYSFACPWLVKRFATYSAFAGEGRGANQVREEFTSLLTHPVFVKESDLTNVVREYYKSYADRPAADDGDKLDRVVADAQTRIKAVEAAEKITVETSKVSEAFWYVRDYYDQIRPALRALVFALYGLGLFLFGLVIMQNIWFVVRYTVEHGGLGG